MNRRMLLLERLVQAGLAIGGVTYIVIMLGYPSRAGVVPAIVAVVMLVALVIQVLQGIRHSRLVVADEEGPADAVGTEADEPDGLLGELTPEQLRRLLSVVAWSFVLFGLIQFLGFVLGPTIGIIGLMLSRREPLGLTLGLGLGVGVGLYLLLTHIVMLPWNQAPALELLGLG